MFDEKTANAMAINANIALEAIGSELQCGTKEITSGTGVIGHVPCVEAGSFDEVDSVLHQAGQLGLVGSFEGVEALVHTRDADKVVELHPLPQGSLQSTLAHGE